MLREQQNCDWVPQNMYYYLEVVLVFWVSQILIIDNLQPWCTVSG